MLGLTPLDAVFVGISTSITIGWYLWFFTSWYNKRQKDKEINERWLPMDEWDGSPALPQGHSRTYNHREHWRRVMAEEATAPTAVRPLPPANWRQEGF